MLRVVVGLALLVVLVLAYQGTRTALALRAAAADARVLRAELGEGDLVAARRTAASLTEHAAVARRSSDGWLWAATTWLPGAGSQTDAVRQTSLAGDVLASEVLPSALDAAEEISGPGLRGEDGAVDVDALASLEDPVRTAARGAGRADDALSGVEPAGLLPPLRGRVAELRAQVATLDRSLRSASYAVRLAPAMLGGQGERRYLFVVQNNAEVRATGGLPGSVSLMRVRDGALELEQLGPAASFSTEGAPAVRLGADEERLLGDTLATDFRDSNATPDFPQAATTMTRLVERKVEPRIDGVIALDPVTLGALLEATGPLEVAGQRLDADNAVSKLLFEPYQELGTDEAQDAFFGAVSDGILDALLADGADTRGLVTQLGEGVAQRRVMVWSRDPGEQDLLVKAGIAGALPTGRGADPEVGIYLNDAVGFKIDYFLRHRSEVTEVDCTDDDRQVVQVRTRFASKVPTPVSQLTRFVAGQGEYVPRGVVALNVAMYAPAGGELRALRVDGEPARVAQGEVSGRQVSVLGVSLDPGEETEVVADFVTRPGQDGDPRLEWTPGLEWAPTSQTVRGACG